MGEMAGWSRYVRGAGKVSARFDESENKTYGCDAISFVKDLMVPETNHANAQCRKRKAETSVDRDDGKASWLQRLRRETTNTGNHP